MSKEFPLQARTNFSSLPLIKQIIHKMQRPRTAHTVCSIIQHGLIWIFPIFWIWWSSMVRMSVGALPYQIVLQCFLVSSYFRFMCWQHWDLGVVGYWHQNLQFGVRKRLCFELLNAKFDTSVLCKNVQCHHFIVTAKLQTVLMCHSRGQAQTSYLIWKTRWMWLTGRCLCTSSGNL